MKHWLSASLASGALALSLLSACDRPRQIEESSEVTVATMALIMRMNDVLESTDDGRAVKEALKKLNAPASCVIMTDTDTRNVSQSKVLCQTGPLPGSPKGRIAALWPIEFSTTLWAGNHLSTIGVHLENGVFDPESGCGIYIMESSRRVIGSSDKVCNDINQNASKILDEYEKMIDEWLKGNGNTI